MKKPEDKPLDTSRFLTRIQTADLLNCNADVLMALERKGKLTRYTRPTTTVTGPREVTVYDPIEIAGLEIRARKLTRDPGELAARAFAMFDLGLAMRDIVVQMRMTPDEVIALRAKWLEMGGDPWMLNAATRKTIGQALEPLGFTANSIPEIVDAILALVERAKK